MVLLIVFLSRLIYQHAQTAHQGGRLMVTLSDKPEGKISYWKEKRKQWKEEKESKAKTDQVKTDEDDKT